MLRELYANSNTYPCNIDRNFFLSLGPICPRMKPQKDGLRRISQSNEASSPGLESPYQRKDTEVTRTHLKSPNT